MESKVGEDCSFFSLPPHHSGLATRDFKSYISKPTEKPLKVYRSNAEWWESLASFQTFPSSVFDRLSTASNQKLARVGESLKIRRT